MKKVIEGLASKNNLTTGYSGTTRTMYIKGEKAKEFIAHIHQLYPDLAFELKIAVRTPGFQPIGEPINLPNENISLQFGTFDTSDTVASLELDESPSISPKPKPTPEEVDLYLLSNPVDRKAKGPYNAAAEHFGVPSDYIRKRWARLRERKLVEQETVNS